MQEQQQSKQITAHHGLGKKIQLPFPQIPDKIYFTIGEVSKLCLLEPYVLRYWEKEFPQLSPSKRRGNRRYYRCDEILLIRNIRSLLYEQGFTIEGARMKLSRGKSTVESGKGQSVELIKDVLTQLKSVLGELGKD